MKACLLLKNIAVFEKEIEPCSSYKRPVLYGKTVFQLNGVSQGTTIFMTNRKISTILVADYPGNIPQ